MNLTYLFLICLFCIVIFACFASERQTLKLGLSGLVGVGLCLSYVFMERGFSNLQSFNGMSAYFYYSIKTFIDNRGLSEEQGYILGEGIWLLILFAAFFLIADIVLSFFPLGKAPLKGHVTWTKILGVLVFVSSFGFACAYFLSASSSLFSLPLGGMSSLFQSLGRRLI